MTCVYMTFFSHFELQDTAATYGGKKLERPVLSENE